MRLTARLYLAFKNVVGKQNEINPIELQNNAADMFRRETITLFGKAVNVLCEKEHDDETDNATITGQKSSLKVNILYLVKSNAQLLMGFFLMNNQDKQNNQVDEFLQILKLLENEFFGDAYYGVNYRNNVNQKKPNLFQQMKMCNYLLISECEEVMKTADVMDINSSNFVSARAATATYLIIFNARRGGEPMRLLKSQWDEALYGEWTDHMPEGDENDLLVTFQTGKGVNHLVPVMFPPQTHKPMQYLMNSDVRENANVSSTNTYAFPSVGNSQNHADGWHAVNAMLIKISRKGAINATKNRHRVASLLSRLQLTSKEKDLIFKHFGHSKNVNEDIYQAAAGTMQVQSTGQKLFHVTYHFSYNKKMYRGIKVKKIRMNMSLSQK